MPKLTDLCNAFLTSKKALLDNGELSIHSWNDYFATCEALREFFGGGRLLVC